MRSLAAFGFSLLLLAACDRAPSADGAPEWKPSDHDRIANQRVEQQQRGSQPAPQAQAPQPTSALPPGHPPASPSASSAAAPAPSASASSSALSTEALADLAWNNQCSSCHGPTGRGDGPQAPMMHPPDFGSKEWQAQHTDAELAASIANGKNKMPKFGLPERVIVALVARVRSAAR